MKRIKWLMVEVEWIFDFYFAWMTYNGRKLHRYHEYMIKRWGTRYTKLYK